jgi:hypothetical protein
MKGCIVYVNEEYSYRHWTWHTRMTEEELITWWREQPKLTDSMIKSLPGKVEKIKDVTVSPQRLYYAHLHKDDDSYLRIVSTNKIIQHAGYEETEYGTEGLVSDT